MVLKIAFRWPNGSREEIVRADMVVIDLVAKTLVYFVKGRPPFVIYLDNEVKRITIYEAEGD